jgi:type VII secretion-associated serine protease mycosin
VALVLVGVGLSAPGAAHADDIRDGEWHLGFLDVAKAQQIARGQGVTVAIVDSGVDYRHPDLTGCLLEGRTFGGGRIDGWEDSTGHGTAMASLIAGRGHGPGHGDGVLGIAPAAKLLPVRVHSSDLGDGRGLVLGIKWAADHGADIINVSQGDVDSDNLHEATNYALEQGAVVIAAVGNANQGDQTVAAPGLYPGVVAVSATDHSGNIAEESVSGPQVVLSAPGTDIMAAGSGKRGRYATGTGTSDSTAIVSGVAALIKSKYPDMDAANIINRLIATADDKGPEGRDSEYGFGIVNPVKALTAGASKVKANPLISPTPSASSPEPFADDSSVHGIPILGMVGIGALLLVVLVGLGFVLFARKRLDGQRR